MEGIKAEELKRKPKDSLPTLSAPTAEADMRQIMSGEVRVEI